MFTNQLRFKGFSGMDIKGMVTQIMRAESFRLDRLNQRRTRLQWQQEALQAVTANMRAMQSRHLNFTNPALNLRGQATFNTFDITSMRNGIASAAVTAATNPDANITSGNYRLSVGRLASSDEFTFAPHVQSNLTGTMAGHGLSGGNFRAGDQFFIQVDNGANRLITIDTHLAEALNTGSPVDVGGVNRTAQEMLNSQLASIYGGSSTAPNFVRFEIDGNNISLRANAGHTAVVRLAEQSSTRATQEPNTLAIRSFANVSAANWNNAAWRNANLNSWFRDGADAREAIFTINGEDVSVGLSDAALERVRSASDLARELNAALAEQGVTAVSFGITRSGTTQNPVETLNLNFTGAAVFEYDRAGGKNADSWLSTRLAGTNVPINGIRMSNVLLDMGFRNNQTSRITMDRTLEFAFGLDPAADPARPSVWPPAGGIQPGGWPHAQGSFTISAGGTGNAVTVNYRADMTIQELIDQVAATGVARMEYDWQTNNFRIVGTATGYEGSLSFDFGNSDTTTGMARFLATASDGGNATQTGTAQNALVSITGPDNIHRFLERSTNTFEFNGIHFTLREVTGNVVETTPGSGSFRVDGDPVVVNIARNLDRPVDAIREFVESYNTFFSEIRAMHMTPRQRPPGDRFAFFEPLTSDQRASMSETEIREWEEQARVGLLHRDQSLQEIMNLMREQIFNPVRLSNGQTMALFEIGITLTREGTLEINESRLEQALTERSADIAELFTNHPGGIRTDANFRSRLNNSGIATRMDDIINLYTFPGSGRLIQRAGSPDHVVQNTFLRRIQDMDTSIANMTRTLARRENALFAKFAAMEAAVLRSNQQIDQLWSMLGM
jgi:flagellar hook-associated protein 2